MSRQFSGDKDVNGVFAQEEIECLEDEAIFEPEPIAAASTTGKRKVFVVLNPPSDFSTSSSSSSSASISMRDFSPSRVYKFELPMTADSSATLEWVGLIPSTAKEIFKRYCDRPDPGQNPDSLMDYALAHVSELTTRRFEDMDLREAIMRIGLNQQIQEALTDPEFSDIFWTKDLHCWVNDTLNLNYATLLSRQELLKNHASRCIAYRKDNEPATINITPQDFQFPAAHVAIEPNSPILPEHVVLYKGKGFCDLNEPRHIVRHDGSIGALLLATQPGGDFNWKDFAGYWTPEKETAEQDRKWAARRNPRCETCILEIQISKDFLNALKPAELWYSADWKRYIWFCRNAEVPDNRFDYLWKPDQVDVVKGHICTGISKNIRRIREQDIETEITEDNVLRCRSTNHKAIQWAFLSHTLKQLVTEIRGKMHIEIVAPLESTQQK
ncbi:hypothetical protein DTO021D3_5083 [Paecilomyces variotii]|nr:hypothetical protein DTO032I3_6809 [Paecilomyces variotii]KAJ9278116.1 hypothetical protein DTO021D3_5083 [Paecilomyces variotii]KAJ9345795.1 hypothetical protein DTO027B6_1755 [Paecilomyces variotii]KAJ9387357.1 hypothetical protein DTO032I4_3221 [Paecilomyces variotii]